jgi:T5orf172 domain
MAIKFSDKSTPPRQSEELTKSLQLLLKGKPNKRKAEFDRLTYQRNYMRGVRSEKCYIYVISAESGPLKIGIARKLAERLDTLQSCSPVKLFLRAAWEMETSVEAQRLEIKVHGALSEYHSHREWFDCPLDKAVETIIYEGAKKRVDLASFTPKEPKRTPWDRHKP